MKKIISLFLAIMLVVSMSTSALALDTESIGHISSRDSGIILQDDYTILFDITYKY